MAAEHTDDVTFLGAHVVPEEYEGRADEYVELVCTEMLAACAPPARWIDVFCERGAFDADQSRAVLTRLTVPPDATPGQYSALIGPSRWDPGFPILPAVPAPQSANNEPAQLRPTDS